MDRVEELIQKSKLLVNKYKNLLETNKAQELKIKELEDEINKFKNIEEENQNLAVQISELTKERNEIRQRVEEIVDEIDQLGI
ncbi:MAG: hypothetical protein A2Y62_06115 [Candidatus Fischerbacteria bacterium RBG_13_37_8]|uniref:Cell division protein ZapB n=1 Tax=Candidatus Fischerbacteria bacterium RBG_13_37_8 TaxID=1817863 RepID=A0A1F5VRP7_9BACT|nr:MAG: hypothetical protein A2Y62_06115 [Candidatus Fischerbacteria bacterium RBG_13_37_8]